MEGRREEEARLTTSSEAVQEGPTDMDAACAKAERTEHVLPRSHAAIHVDLLNHVFDFASLVSLWTVGVSVYRRVTAFEGNSCKQYLFEDLFRGFVAVGRSGIINLQE